MLGRISLTMAAFLAFTVPASAASLTISGPIQFGIGAPDPGNSVEILLDLNLSVVDTNPIQSQGNFENTVNRGTVFVDGAVFFEFEAPSISTFSFINFDAADDAFDFSSASWTIGDGSTFEIRGDVSNEHGLYNGKNMSDFHHLIALLDPGPIFYASGGHVLTGGLSVGFEYDPQSFTAIAVPIPLAGPLLAFALFGLGLVSRTRR